MNENDDENTTVTLSEEEEELLRKQLILLENERIAIELEKDYDHLYNTLLSIYNNISYNNILKQSKDEREYYSYNTTTLTYSEITFNGIYNIFKKLRLLGFIETFGGIFIDIGSGSGNAVFGACLCHNFQATYGIEILSSLYKISQKAFNNWIDIRQNLSQAKRATNLSFHIGDALLLDWSDGDIVFINSTCFDKDMMQQFGKLAGRLKYGSYVITVTFKLPSKVFELVSSFEADFSWGKGIVLIHRRLEELEEGQVTDVNFLKSIGIQVKAIGEV